MIVPAYRVAKLVGETLRSVQAQTIRNWECLVVDDGSDDGTAEVVRAFAAEDLRIRLFRQAHLGLSAARNTGLKNASRQAPYVAFLDSDDLWCYNALDQLIEALCSDPNAVGVYGYAELIDYAGNPIEQGLHPARQARRRQTCGWTMRTVPAWAPVNFNEWVVAGPLWPPATGLHRREVVDAVGFFDTRLRQCEDVDFYTRMSRHGYHQPLSAR